LQITSNPIAAKIVRQENVNGPQLHVYNTPLTNLKDFLKLRQVKDKEDNTEDSDLDDNEDFEDNNPLMFLVKKLFGQAHGQRKWGSAKCLKRISAVMTVTDEAFVLLSMMENCWDAIQKEIKEGDDKEDGKRGICARGKYTNQETNMKYGRCMVQRRNQKVQ
jgi:hypothetical protein